VKTENPSACATVNGKLCKLAVVLCLSVIKGTCNQGANKCNHPNQNPLFSSRVPPLHVTICFIQSFLYRNGLSR
jgi:hypothetical protein